MFDPTHRFGFGVNLDDPWRYVGEAPPKSIIIPHLLSVSLPEGRTMDDGELSPAGSTGVMVGENTEAQSASATLATRMSQAKLDFARCWFPWNYFEPNPVPSNALDNLLQSGYDRWPFDELVNTLLSHGVGLIPVLACGYQRMLPDGLNVDSNREEYLRRVAVHARLLVRHYKDRVKCWQVENEPNWWAEHSAGGWRSGTTWLEPGPFKEQLLQTLNTAVRSEDPNAIIMVNLEADAKKLATAWYAQYCDALGLDYYPNYRTSTPVNTLPFKEVRETVKGVEKPVLVIETGYPSGPFLLGYTPSKQAEYVKSACAEAYSSEELDGLGIWRYTDTSWRSFPYQENHFGLFDSRGNPKPGWTTLVETVGELRR